MSKAFLFADLHSRGKQLSNLREFLIGNDDVDCLIFAGDVVNMGEPVWFMEKFIEVIDEIKKPFHWVPGNNDFGRAYYKLNAKCKSLEGRVEMFPPLSKGRVGGVQESIKFTGVGGSPASWAGQYAGESMIDQKDIAGTIFVSHYPPPGLYHLEKHDQQFSNINSQISINDQLKNDKINGNWKMKNGKLSEKHFSNAPLVHICGHLHYKWGTALLGQTKIIQLASLETGHYAILNLETLAVKFERF